MSTEQAHLLSRPHPGAWAPLASPVFRMFWIASLASNIGTWVHEVGSGWLMSSLDDSPQMVSAVRVAMSLPILLLAIPAGALVDRVDRRRLLITIQSLLMAATAVLALMTYTRSITPTSLLVLTVIMALALVIHVPAWQASIPELVPRDQIQQAVALGSISFNLARSVGPALGGLLIATFGTWVAFAVNGLSFGIVIAALVSWRRGTVDVAKPESFLASIRTGSLYVMREPVMRNVLLRVILFVVPASALWSLIPLIAREQLHWDSRGYGYLVGAIGIGAVAAAILLPRLRQSIGVDQTIFAAMCVFGSGLAVTSISTNAIVTMAAMFVMGVGWMLAMTTLNSTAQITLANAIRARGMSYFLSAMAGGMAVGAWLWGLIAQETSPELAQLAAAAILPVHAVVGLMLPIRPHSEQSGLRTPP
ncbi:MAG: MFS transporter [Planctomycetaceae bacterium]